MLKDGGGCAEFKQDFGLVLEEVNASNKDVCGARVFPCRGCNRGDRGYTVGDINGDGVGALVSGVDHVGVGFDFGGPCAFGGIDGGFDVGGTLEANIACGEHFAVEFDLCTLSEGIAVDREFVGAVIKVHKEGQDAVKFGGGVDAFDNKVEFGRGLSVKVLHPDLVRSGGDGGEVEFGFGLDLITANAIRRDGFAIEHDHRALRKARTVDAKGDLLLCDGAGWVQDIEDGGRQGVGDQKLRIGGSAAPDVTHTERVFSGVDADKIEFARDLSGGNKGRGHRNGLKQDFTFFNEAFAEDADFVELCTCGSGGRIDAGDLGCGEIFDFKFKLVGFFAVGVDGFDLVFAGATGGETQRPFKLSCGKETNVFDGLDAAIEKHANLCGKCVAFDFDFDGGISESIGRIERGQGGLQIKVRKDVDVDERGGAGFKAIIDDQFKGVFPCNIGRKCGFGGVASFHLRLAAVGFCFESPCESQGVTVGIGRRAAIEQHFDAYTCDLIGTCVGDGIAICVFAKDFDGDLAGLAGLIFIVFDDQLNDKIARSIGHKAWFGGVCGFQLRLAAFGFFGECPSKCNGPCFGIAGLAAVEGDFAILSNALKQAGISDGWIVVDLVFAAFSCRADVTGAEDLDTFGCLGTRIFFVCTGIALNQKKASTCEQQKR